MTRQLVIELSPFIGWMAAAVAGLALLARLSRARWDWAQLARVHRDERGAVQSLSFVLTVPVYVMLLLFIIQLSQLTIAKVMVEYSAFVAARSAMVWLPASMGNGVEGLNQVRELSFVRYEEDDNGLLYAVYRVNPASAKHHRIWYATVSALLPIAPSRDAGAVEHAESRAALASIEKAYLAAAPSQASNPRISTRLRRKLAYAWNNTALEIFVRHRQNEPPLETQHIFSPFEPAYWPGEFGWHDQIIVQVRHDFALLPGPGRLLAKRITNSSTSSGSTSGGSVGSSVPAVDRIAPQIRQKGNQHVYSLTATATLHGEGQKPVIPFLQDDVGPLRLTFIPSGVTGSYGARRPTSQSGADDASNAWLELPLPPPASDSDEDCCLPVAGPLVPIPSADANDEVSP